MAIRLLDHFRRLATPLPGSDARPHAGDWAIEAREPSRWNPISAARGTVASPARERPADPVWPETQPYCHD